MKGIGIWSGWTKELPPLNEWVQVDDRYGTTLTARYRGDGQWETPEGTSFFPEPYGVWWQRNERINQQTGRMEFDE